MPSISSLVAFAVVSFVLIVIPGPSVMFVVGRALSLGRRAALVTVAGNAAGFYIQVVLVAVGLGAIVERSVAVFTTVKLIGAAYLVFLGVQAIAHRKVNAEPSIGGAEVVNHRSLFVDGFVVGIANPKTLIFFAATLPQFVDRGAAPAGLQMLALGVLFAAIALVSDSVWGLAAGTARTWFVSSPRRLELVGAAGGVAIVALGVRLALDQPNRLNSARWPARARPAMNGISWCVLRRPSALGPRPSFGDFADRERDRRSDEPCHDSDGEPADHANRDHDGEPDHVPLRHVGHSSRLGARMLSRSMRRTEDGPSACSGAFRCLVRARTRTGGRRPLLGPWRTPPRQRTHRRWRGAR